MDFTQIQSPRCPGEEEDGLFNMMENVACFCNQLEDGYTSVLVTGLSNCFNIPLICNFFTRAKFLENKIYTEKRQFFGLNL